MPKPGRNDKDIDLGMAEEPEQVLEQDRIAAAGRVEEGGVEIAVGQQHRQRAGEDRQGQQQQKRGDQNRPREERHPEHRHARRAHIEDRGDEVDRPDDRRHAGDVERQDDEIDRRPRRAG
jgi:hypothetical protein